jgi:hypothetical protein
LAFLDLAFLTQVPDWPTVLLEMMLRSFFSKPLTLGKTWTTDEFEFVLQFMSSAHVKEAMLVVKPIDLISLMVGSEFFLMQSTGLPLYYLNKSVAI